MIASQFSHIRAWVFDLDNTLYPPAARLFDQIEVKMNAYVMRELGLDHARADQLRKHYWAEYGTTLAGLIREHQIEPWAYLNDVHDIDMSHLTPAPDLAELILTLPGRRIVYTNGDAPYARRVLAARGLGEVFDAVYGIEHADWRPKPEQQAFQSIFQADGLDPTRAAMFEDDPRNLAAPHAMGMRTIHVAPQPMDQPFIHHHTDDLTGFLSQLLAVQPAAPI